MVFNGNQWYTIGSFCKGMANKSRVRTCFTPFRHPKHATGSVIFSIGSGVRQGRNDAPRLLNLTNDLIMRQFDGNITSDEDAVNILVTDIR